MLRRKRLPTCTGKLLVTSKSVKMTERNIPHVRLPHLKYNFTLLVKYYYIHQEQYQLIKYSFALF